jgi:RHS repeat-associated protein
VTVTGSNGGPWTVTFTGSHANVNVASLQGDAANTQSGSVNRTISYTYDVASQLTDISDSDSTYAYTYDNIGRVLTTSNSGTSGVPTVVLTNVYDAASNRTQLSATIGGTNDFKNDYTFDNLNRMTQVAQIGNGGNTVANKRANFAYNALGQFTSVERQVKPSSTWNEVATTAFTYDTLNRVTGIDHKRSGTSLFTAYAYTYDRMDRITGITSQDGTVAYGYDKTSQIVSADYSYQTDETFTWDANGNPSGGGNTVGTNNRLTSDGTYNYTFDDEGNMTRRTKISDGSYTDYTYDPRNRLTSVVNKTSGGTATMSADYAYDVYDRRIKKVVDADGAGGGGSVTARYVYEDTGYTQVVLQFDGSSNLTHRYLHGPAIDELLADEDASNAILWSLPDHQGTVRDVINNSGTVQNHLKYSAFGNVTAESAAAVDFLMGFAGMDRDEETNSWYSWMRHMENGRWKSEDPIGFTAGDANLKRYVGNSPVDYVDPSGLEVVPLGRYESRRANDPTAHVELDNQLLLEAHRDMLLGITDSARSPSADRTGVRHVNWRTVTIVMALESRTQVGHTGIGIEDRYYDLGPGANNSTRPWWDNDFDDSGDSSLGDVIDDLQEHVDVDVPPQVMVIFRWDVEIGRARAIEDYWIERYDRMDPPEESFSLIGQNCTTTVLRSLRPVRQPDLRWRPAIGVPNILDTTTPATLLRRLADLRHTAGPNRGERPRAEVFIVTPP